ncbi:MAG: aspartate--tRNA ligase [Ignavibacteriae bacterium]|nr:aspartate--tRNA ligase [Ignavibacteriota bacterium]
MEEIKKTHYRSHTCGELNINHLGEYVRLAGWVYKVRNLGGMTFITLRDHYGITQVIIPNNASKKVIENVGKLRPESVVFVEGVVMNRGKDKNLEISTGEIEVECKQIEIDSIVENLPFPLDDNPNEELRLKYRFLDLRKQRLHRNIVFRAKLLHEIRVLMSGFGFTEIQTPILTVSSPEGARDYLVPSRLHPGKFYALPQAPQQYKQLLMCSGFDKYYQIAPCFRDENARADRSPGEFYQLDIEMAYVGQEDVFRFVENFFNELNERISDRKIKEFPFPRIKYYDSMNWYGNDKPDLRFDMKIQDVTDVFTNTEFNAFKQNTVKGKTIKGLVAEGCADRPRSFYDKLEKVAKKYGARGLAHITFGTDGEIKSPIKKFLSDAELESLKAKTGLTNGDSLILCAGDWQVVCKSMGVVRADLANKLDLIDHSELAYCWIVDFPLFEYDQENEKIDFSHNPFSMPQGGLEALNTKDPLEILAYQYDIVCNGYELSSGAIRNHRPDIMYKAFEIAGYNKEQVDKEFGHMISAFKFGAPPHGGLAPGIDRIAMIYSDEPNIREVIAFPMNQKAQELMMGAPSYVEQKQLDELSLSIDIKE